MQKEEKNKLILSKESSKRLLILLAKKHNQAALKRRDYQIISVEEIQNDKIPSKLVAHLWSVLHPAGYKLGFNIESWRDILKNSVTKKDAFAEFEKKKQSTACNYDVIRNIVKLFEGSHKSKIYSPRNPEITKCICSFLEISQKQLHDTIFGQVNTPVPAPSQLNAFQSTRWYGYYRSRNPETLRVCIVKCCIIIDDKGNVIVNNRQKTINDGDFYNYIGKIEVNQNQLLITLKHEEGSNGDNIYILFSIPHAARSHKELTIINGIYVQTVPSNYSTRGRSIVLRKTERQWDEMTPALINNTNMDSIGNPRLPFSHSYESFEEQIKRLLFEKHQNYLSTLKTNMSRDVDFIQKLVEWDFKFSTKSRCIYDIYFSCPIGTFYNDEKGFNDMKDKMNSLVQTMKERITFIDYPKNTDLTIRTPFDPDKFPRYDVEVSKINPKFKCREIENSKLFVMYYPDTSVPSSCIVEASWAIQSGVCCLFIVDKEEGLPRYLRRSSFIKQYPIFISEGGQIKSFQEAGYALGRSISFK